MDREQPQCGAVRVVHLSRRQEAFYRENGWIVESACDLRVGGEWTIDFGPSMEVLTRHTHRFNVVNPPRRLLLATTEHRTDGSRFTFTNEFTFVERDGRTLMTMIQTGIPPSELRDAWTRRAALVHPA